jgi:hypothetical protein
LRAKARPLPEKDHKAVYEWWLLLFLIFPLYLALMAGIMRLYGATKMEVVAWLLRSAERQRLADLIRAARGLPAPPPGPSEPSAVEPPKEDETPSDGGDEPPSEGI